MIFSSSSRYVFCLVFVTFYLSKMTSILTAAAINIPVDHVAQLPIDEVIFFSQFLTFFFLPIISRYDVAQIGAAVWPLARTVIATIKL